ncbi:MAG: polymer-forming cytoskeletal protein [Eubacteriales bacterium]|nr:polymer-forming cytoskeletal protein [Eubacteriales bacterium]
MFRSNTKETINLDKVDTLISSKVMIEGNIKATGTIRLDCQTTGDIEGQGFIIGETGSVKGDVKCDSIIIAGRVEGNVSAEDKIHIKASGTLIGDIEVGRVIIDEGAVFKGLCKMLFKNLDKSNSEDKDNKN